MTETAEKQAARLRCLASFYEGCGLDETAAACRAGAEALLSPAAASIAQDRCRMLINAIYAGPGCRP